MKLKYSKLETKAIKCKDKDREKYYKYVLQICENDIDNIDKCCSSDGILGEFFNIKLNAKLRKQLLEKIQNLFKREHANIDGQSNDLESWLDFLELNIHKTTKYMMVKVEGA